MTDNISKLKDEMRDILEGNILNFWMERMTDNENGGYYGRIDGHDNLDPKADKGAVLNARLLWSFSSAYRLLREPEYKIAAERAKRYILEHFVDKDHGGVYWSLDYTGKPVDEKKQTYAIGFSIYGMSEYVRATGDKEALDMALALYHDVEKHAFDSRNNGYVEALTRDWKPIADMRLSDKDENGSRTMNTHLHIIEPYTNLYRVLREILDGKVKVDGYTREMLNAELETLDGRLKNLLDIFTEKLLNKETCHLDLFFDDEWQGKRNIQSFGHDIEACWLLHETALVIGERQILDKIEPLIQRIAQAADEGLREDGAMVYEKWTDTGVVDLQRQWWVQCECVIGHMDLYQYFGDSNALDVALKCWDFTKKYLVDKERGEWHWAMLDDGTVNLEDDKAGFWKCPYHNSRMCIELIERDF